MAIKMQNIKTIIAVVIKICLRIDQIWVCLAHSPSINIKMTIIEPHYLMFKNYID